MSTSDPKMRGAILVVEDDDDVREELGDVLEGEHYVVLEAREGREALDILRSAAGPSICLIVLDLVMPCMSGWELVDILRRDSKLSRVPILVTSGIALHGDASGIAATMSWIRKPFDADAFVAAVDQSLAAAPDNQRPECAPVRTRNGRPSSPSHHDL